MECRIQEYSYSESEKETLSALYYDILREEFHWVDPSGISLESFQNSTDGEAVYVAYWEGEAAGFVSVWEPDRFIHNLFVAKRHRNRGVGKKLLEKVFERYEKLITLKCVKENKNALEFYLNHGWRISREEMGPEGAYYWMEYSR